MQYFSSHFFLTLNWFSGQCPAGQGAEGTGPCTICPRGTYKPASQLFGPCIDCPDGFTTPNVGSTAQSDCNLGECCTCCFLCCFSFIQNNRYIAYCAASFSRNSSCVHGKLQTAVQNDRPSNIVHQISSSHDLVSFSLCVFALQLHVRRGSSATTRTRARRVRCTSSTRCASRSSARAAPSTTSDAARGRRLWAPLLRTTAPVRPAHSRMAEAWC